MRTRNWPRLNLSSCLFAVLLAGGCSFFKGKGNERAEGHRWLYSDPLAPSIEVLPAHQRRLVFVATNDWQGSLEPRTEVARDSHHPQEILVSVGGVDVFARYLHILRSLYPDQVVTVDAGNSLAGTIEARASGAEAVLGAFQELKYDAVALATPDLAAGPGLKKGATSAIKWLPPLLEKTSTPTLISNLIDLHTTAPVTWGPSVPQALKVVNGVKVGFIGLLGDGSQLDAGLMNGLYIEPRLQALLKQTRALKLKGAEVIVLLAYGGLRCGEARAKKTSLPLSKVNFDTADSGACGTDGDLASFIQKIPVGMIDLIVTGGGPSKVANVVQGIPVVQAFAKGAAFSRVDLIYDQAANKVLVERTKIHQPTRLCHRFFKETEDCYTEDSSVDHRHLAPAMYLGQEIMPDKKMTEWHGPWRDAATKENARLITSRTTRQDIVRCLRETLGTDLALVNSDSGAPKTASSLSQRDLWKIPGATDKIRLVLLRGADLESFRNYIDDLDANAEWSTLLTWNELGQQTQVLLALPQQLWTNVIEVWARARGLGYSSYLAPQLVADALMPPEMDVLSSLESASDREPLLPRTQP